MPFYTQPHLIHHPTSPSPDPFPPYRTRTRPQPVFFSSAEREREQAAGHCLGAEASGACEPERGAAFGGARQVGA
jgi:hypothetical protein